jgi:hypothetical protein
MHLLPPAESYLLSGAIAVLVLFWLPPIPPESYVHWFLTHLVILFGAYLSAFKVPRLFSGFLGLRLAGVLCILLYSGGCWFLIKQEAKRRTEANE